MPGARLCALIATSTWWSPSTRMASTLVRDGCSVWALCPAGHPIREVRGLGGVQALNPLDPVASLRQAVVRGRPDVVVPCDEGAVMQLHALRKLAPSFAALVERSIGPDADGEHALSISRFRLLELAREAGIRVPRTARVEGPDDLRLWHREVQGHSVVKIDASNGGNGVRIVGSLGESIAALQALRRPMGLAMALKRTAIDRDPLAWSNRRSHGTADVTVQAYVRGSPANAMFARYDGRLLGAVCVKVVASDGPTGAAMAVRLIDDPQMLRAGEIIGERLRMNGFYGLDFVIDAEAGRPWLIEMNPRCTQLGHLELPQQASLARLFSAALRGEPAPQPLEPVPHRTIALFPLGLQSPWADLIDPHAYRDVPREEPALARELMRPPWPRRRWASRLYHALRPPRGSEFFAHEQTGTQTTV